MRKGTTASGFITICVVLLVYVFKFQHYPGSGLILLLAGISTLVFLCFLLLEGIKEATRLEKTIRILGLVLGWILVLSTIFSIQHYPGSGLLLVLKLFGLPLFSLAILFIAFRKHPKSHLFITAGVLASVIALPSSVNDARNYSRPFVVANLDVESSIIIPMASSDALWEQFSSDSLLREKRNKARDVRESANSLFTHIEDLKRHLMMEVDAEVKMYGYDSARLDMVTALENRDIPTNIMIGEPASPHPSDKEWSGLELKSLLEQYKNDLDDLAPCNGSSNTPICYDDIIHTRELIHKGPYGGFAESWEVYHFYRMPLGASVTFLSTLQLNVRQAELHALQILAAS